MTCDVSKTRSTSPKLSSRDYLMALSIFLITLITLGNNRILSVLIIEWLKEFPQSKSLILFVPNLTRGLMSAAGFINGILINRFGIFKIMFLGSFLQSLSLLASSFSTNAITLVILLGLLLGFGQCFSFVNSFILMGIQFGDAGKSFIAILSLAGPLCNVIFPNLVPLYIGQYGWRGGILIHSAINLQMIPLALFLLLSAKHKKKKQQKEDASKILTDEPNEVQITQKKTCDLSIFQDPLYIIYLCAVSSCLCVSNILYSSLPNFLNKKGLGLKDSAFLYSIYGGTTAVPRILFMVSHRRIQFRFVFLFIVSSSMCGLMCVAINYIYSYSNLLIGCILVSIFMGGPSGLYNIGVLECVGPEKYSIGSSILETSIGVWTAILGYMFGSLIVYMDSYLQAFSISGGLILVTNAILLITNLVKSKRLEEDTSFL